MVGWYVGAFINLVGNICANLGTNIMKLGHNKRSALDMPEDEKPKIFKSSYWRAGVAIFVVGSMLCFASFAFAAQSLLAALGSTQLVSNVVFASLINKEPATWFIVLSVACIVGGTIILVVFGNHSTQVYTVDELVDLYKEKPYVVYLVIMAVTLLGMFALYHHGRRLFTSGLASDLWLQMLPVTYSIYSALLGTQSVLFSKSLSILLRGWVAGVNPLADWYLYVALLCFVITAIFWGSQLHKGIMNFPAMIIAPLMQIMWTFFSILCGLVYFQEYKAYTTLSSIMFAVGVVIVFVGVYMLTKAAGIKREGYDKMHEALVLSEACPQQDAQQVPDLCFEPKPDDNDDGSRPLTRADLNHKGWTSLCSRGRETSEEAPHPPHTAAAMRSNSMRPLTASLKEQGCESPSSFRSRGSDDAGAKDKDGLSILGTFTHKMNPSRAAHRMSLSAIGLDYGMAAVSLFSGTMPADDLYNKVSPGSMNGRHGSMNLRRATLDNVVVTGLAVPRLAGCRGCESSSTRISRDGRPWSPVGSPMAGDSSCGMKDVGFSACGVASGSVRAANSPPEFACGRDTGCNSAMLECTRGPGSPRAEEPRNGVGRCRSPGHSGSADDFGRSLSQGSTPRALQASPAPGALPPLVRCMAEGGRQQHTLPVSALAPGVVGGARLPVAGVRRTTAHTPEPPLSQGHPCRPTRPTQHACCIQRSPHPSGPCQRITQSSAKMGQCTVAEVRSISMRGLDHPVNRGHGRVSPAPSNHKHQMCVSADAHDLLIQGAGDSATDPAPKHGRRRRSQHAELGRVSPGLGSRRATSRLAKDRHMERPRADARVAGGQDGYSPSDTSAPRRDASIAMAHDGNGVLRSSGLPLSTGRPGSAGGGSSGGSTTGLLCAADPCPEHVRQEQAALFLPPPPQQLVQCQLAGSMRSPTIRKAAGSTAASNAVRASYEILMARQSQKAASHTPDVAQQQVDPLTLRCLSPLYPLPAATALGPGASMMGPMCPAAPSRPTSSGDLSHEQRMLSRPASRTIHSGTPASHRLAIQQHLNLAVTFPAKASYQVAGVGAGGVGGLQGRRGSFIPASFGDGPVPSVLLAEVRGSPVSWQSSLAPPAHVQSGNEGGGSNCMSLLPASGAWQ